MLGTRNLSHILAREPTPVESQVEEYLHPVKVGETAELVHGFSLAPKYTLKQLKAIERRRARNKLDFPMDATGGTKAY